MFPSPRFFLPSLCLALLAGAEPDAVVLAHGQELAGVILSGPEETGPVRIKTQSGILSLPKELVKEVRRGLTSRLAALKADDVNGHAVLGLWCDSQGFKDEALRLLRRAYDLGSKNVQGVGTLGRLLDEVEKNCEEALKFYKEYRDTLQGKDPALLARLAEIESSEASFIAAKEQAMERIKNLQEQEGLEKEFWQGDNKNYSNQIERELRPLDPKALVSNQVLDVKLLATGKDKAVIRARYEFDGSAGPSFVFFVTAPNLKIPVSLAVKTGDLWDYYESKALPLVGSNEPQRIQFDLKAKDWKSKNSGWTHNGSIGNAANIREIQIQFHNGRQEAHVLIDGIGFLPPAPVEEPKHAKPPRRPR